VVAAGVAEAGVKYLPMPHSRSLGVQTYQSQWVQLAQGDSLGDQVLQQAVLPASQAAQGVQAYQQQADLLLDLMVRVGPVVVAMLGGRSYR